MKGYNSLASIMCNSVLLKEVLIGFRLFLLQLLQYSTTNKNPYLCIEPQLGLWMVYREGCASQWLNYNFLLSLEFIVLMLN